MFWLLCKWLHKKNSRKGRRRKPKQLFIQELAPIKQTVCSSSDGSSSDGDEEESAIRGINKRQHKTQSITSFHWHTSKEPSAFEVQSSTGLSCADKKNISLGDQEVEMRFETAGGGLDGDD